MQNNSQHSLLDNDGYAIWRSEVRDYELDFQNIVNNANYLHYLDHARNVYFIQLGLCVTTFAENNINVVVIDTHLKFRKSLRSNDQFKVLSKLKRISKLKFMFKQTICLEKTSELILEAETILCCMDAAKNKPCIPTEFEIFAIESV